MFPDKHLASMKHYPLEPLQKIEDEWGLGMLDTSKDRIKFLKREFGFLDIFLSLQSFTDRWDVLDVTHTVQTLFHDAAVDLRKVNKIEHVDRVTTKVQEKIWMSKVEIRSEYSFPIISSNKETSATPDSVMEFIDTVVETLSDLVGIHGSSSLLFVPGPKNELEDVLEELKLLRHFVCYVSDRCIEPQSQLTNFLTHILEVMGHAAMVAWLYLPCNGNGNQDLAPTEMNELLSVHLQMKIKPIQPGIRKIYVDVLQALKSTIQSGWYPNIRSAHAAVCVEAAYVETLAHNLADLPAIGEPHQNVVPTGQIVVLQEMLNLLTANLNHLSIQDLEFHLQDIDTVIVDSALLVYSLYASIEENEEMALGDVTLHLLGNIQNIKTVIYHIIRMEFQSNLPRIHGLGYVDFLLNNLKEFQHRYPDSIAFVETLLQILQLELESLQPFLKAVAKEQHNNNKKLLHSVALLIGKAYEVEYIIDACVRTSVPDWCLTRWLMDIIDEMRAEAATILQNRMAEINLVLHDTDTAHTSSGLERPARIDEEIVGFEYEITTLKRQLIKGRKELDVISIVGMPGAGKTALANRLYFDESVITHFDIRAQCCVSQVYSWRGLLLSILRMLPADVSEVSNPNTQTNNLADTLRRVLCSKRYLILIDGVHDDRVWNDLKPCLYDSNKGSRILLTTQHLGVANDAKSVSEPLHLCMLNDGKSWELLKKKVFGEESCSPLLEKVGRKIARKCGGLPLSIVFVACMLARMERTEQCWKQVARSLGSDIICYPENIIEQSYQNLPYHLKSCFLYFGMFSDQEEINISKLTLLWIGEGFVKNNEDKSLEEIAEGYLKNLVESNLVVLTKRSCGGKVKVCSIQNILFHFCKARAQKENLIRRIERYQGDIYLPKQLAHRRLAFYTEIDHLENISSSCSLVGSVLFREASTNAPSAITQVPNIFHSFKFLKVLDLEFTVIVFFPTELVYLRYFSAGIDQQSIPSSIASLWNLETLILTRSDEREREGYLLVPIEVWEMVKLRHLHISDGSFAIENAEELLENSPELNDLKTLSTPCFSCVEDAGLMFKKTPNIRELRCKFEGFNRGQETVLDFPVLLETLDISGPVAESLSQYPVYISASNLKKLTVSNFRLGLQHLSNIAQLQKLVALELENVIFDDEERGKEETILRTNLQINDKFPLLKVLKLSSCDFEHWTVSDDAFPILERLFLRECQNLREIPSCFGEISTLRYIEVEHCNESVDESARDIRETQGSYENNDFKLCIK